MARKVEFPSNNVDHVDFSLKPDDPVLTPGKVVDLGLSVYWASCNLGAESPEESGNFYAWGETSPKSSYDKENYAYYDKNTTQYVNIGSDISGTQYDAQSKPWWKLANAYSRRVPGANGQVHMGKNPGE